MSCVDLVEFNVVIESNIFDFERDLIYIECGFLLYLCEMIFKFCRYKYEI